MAEPERAALPWEEVNAVDSRRVAEVLGLAKARERDKWGCVRCDSSDALHAYKGGGLKCYSCGGRWSNVDAAAVRWGLNPDLPEEAREALVRLAGLLGIYVPVLDAPTPPRGRGRPPRVHPTPTPPRTEIAAHAGLYAPDPERDRLHQEVFGGILYLTELSAAARAFLEGRGLDATTAHAYGFRSLAPKGWEDVRAVLEGLTPAHRDASGLYLEGAWHPPFGGYAEALVIPYYRDASDHAPLCLRFRSLAAEGKGNRYRDLLNNRPTFPFNAQALQPGTEEVVLTEGELDAYTLHERGEVALGFPGTALNGLEWAVDRLGTVGRVVAFLDADEAGEKAVGKLRDALQARHGAEWVRARLVRRRPTAGKDANDLRVKGLI